MHAPSPVLRAASRFRCSFRRFVSVPLQSAQPAPCRRSFRRFVSVPPQSAQPAPCRRFHTTSTASTMPGDKASRRGTTGPPKPPSVPAPSASVVVVSPTNEILLLHRLETSSTFSSAHVFPGGNLSAFHEGAAIPAVDSPARHVDGPAYRLAAIRETFEESGVLMARQKGTAAAPLPPLAAAARWTARRHVADEAVRFADWLASVGGEPDTDGLIPFTRWITPVTMPRRYTTQMYLYLMPLDAAVPAADTAPTADQSEVMAAEFAPAATWVRRARQGDLIVFPPQVYILSLLAPVLAARPGHYAAERARLADLVRGADWAGRAISPRVVGRMPPPDGRTVMALDFAGEELRGDGGRRGDADRVVLVGNLPPGPPRNIELRPRAEVLPVVEAAKKAAAKAKAGGGGGGGGGGAAGATTPAGGNKTATKL